MQPDCEAQHWPLAVHLHGPGTSAGTCKPPPGCPRLTPAACPHALQIVDALRYMHAHRIMHRDIKPANVLVGANGALKLGDLGLGRQLSEQTMEAFSKVGCVGVSFAGMCGRDWGAGTKARLLCTQGRAQ